MIFNFSNQDMIDFYSERPNSSSSEIQRMSSRTKHSLSSQKMLVSRFVTREKDCLSWNKELFIRLRTPISSLKFLYQFLTRLV